ncbi:MAG: helix-turn-helix domain-containing protein [Desulfobulbus sp.]|jgi:hypothetical protein|nr:helix-turn-helix domain-containing protein [Desulfobulbus sp.]
MSAGDYLITQKEAAEFLQVSTKTISRYRKRGLPHQLILNPVTGKQEVRFRRVDLERWHEGRQLLATYGRDAEEATAPVPQIAGQAAPGPSASPRGNDQGFLNELLAVYREEIEILRDQVEDMREQLARRDRQIDDLMRLMVGLQLEYKPLPANPGGDGRQASGTTGVPAKMLGSNSGPRVYEEPIVIELPSPPPAPTAAPARRTFSRDRLAASVLEMRRRNKSYADIARGLNRLGAATLSGQPEWTVAEVQGLLPSLVAAGGARAAGGYSF